MVEFHVNVWDEEVSFEAQMTFEWRQNFAFAPFDVQFEEDARLSGLHSSIDFFSALESAKLLNWMM